MVGSEKGERTTGKDGKTLCIQTLLLGRKRPDPPREQNAEGRNYLGGWRKKNQEGGRRIISLKSPEFGEGKGGGLDVLRRHVGDQREEGRFTKKKKQYARTNSRCRKVNRERVIFSRKKEQEAKQHARLTSGRYAEQM